jgi:hypothetical protein
MSNFVGDLWPSDLVKPIPSSPITVLKEQALRLGAKTGELVQGDVRPEMDDRWVNLIFELVMPLLENHRYKIFKVAYPADRVYPLHIYVMGDPRIEVESPEQFISQIKAILSSDRIKNAISSFVDMQRPQAPESEFEGSREPSVAI